MNAQPEKLESLLVPYEPALASPWDAFVDASQNGTIYHTRRFLSYHPETRFQDASFLIYEGERLVAVVPAALREMGGRRTLSAHPGASYGGPALARNLELATVAAVVDQLLQFARKRECTRVEMLRLPPKVYHDDPSDELELALSLKGFRLARRELSAAVEVRATETAVADVVSTFCFRHVRKAIRDGVDARFGTDREAWTDYWGILGKVLADRHQARPTHSLAEITRLATELWPDRIRLMGAYRGDRMIGGVVVFVASRRALYTMYIAQDYEFKHLCPTNLALFRVLEWAQANGFRAVDLGVCTEGDDVNWGLYRFKESFGARGSLRDSYLLEW